MLNPAEVEATWPISGVALGEAQASYPSRTVVTVHSDQGTYAAKVVPADAAPDLEERLAVVDHLANRGYPHVPELLRTRSGRRSGVLGRAAVCVLEFVPPIRKDVDAETLWFELGVAAAVLNATTDFGRPYTVGIADAVGELERRVAGEPFATPFLDVLDRVRELDGPGHGLVHGEVNPSNVRQRDDGTLVLVDWDQAGHAATSLEVGYPLITTFIDVATHHVHVTSARAWFAGYAAGGGRIDPTATFDAALFHALRYLWFADIPARWERIAFALRHEQELLALLH